MSDHNVLQLYSVDYVQMLQAACREKYAEIARLTATLPCGHNRVLNDDSYGGCINCTRQSVYDEDQAEIAALQAATRRVVEAGDVLSMMFEVHWTVKDTDEAVHDAVRNWKSALADPVIVALRRE